MLTPIPDNDDVLHLTSLGHGRAVSTQSLPVPRGYNADPVGECNGSGDASDINALDRLSQTVPDVDWTTRAGMIGGHVLTVARTSKGYDAVIDAAFGGFDATPEGAIRNAAEPAGLVLTVRS